MKTIKIIFSLFAIICFTACGNSTETTTEPPAAEVPATDNDKPQNETHRPATPPKEDPDHTNVEIGENGVIYNKKDGGDETSVKIKTDSNSISIRRRK